MVVRVCVVTKQQYKIEITSRWKSRKSILFEYRNHFLVVFISAYRDWISSVQYKLTSRASMRFHPWSFWCFRFFVFLLFIYLYIFFNCDSFCYSWHWERSQQQTHTRYRMTPVKRLWVCLCCKTRLCLMCSLVLGFIRPSFLTIINLFLEIFFNIAQNWQVQK